MFLAPTSAPAKPDESNSLPQIEYIKVTSVEVENALQIEDAAKRLELQPDDFEFSVGGLPLDNIDDPAPLGCKEKEFNYFGDTDRAHGGDVTNELHYDLNWGGCPSHSGRFGKYQLKIEGAYGRKRSANNPNYVEGLSDISVGAKIPLYTGENSTNRLLHQFAVSIYPTVRTEPPGNSARRGAAEPGRAYILPLLVAKEFAIKNIATAVTANIGYEYGAHGAPDEWYWALGTGFAVTPLNQFVMAYSKESLHAMGPSKIVKVEIGFTHALSTNYKLVAMIGRILNSPENLDGRSHLLANFGLRYSYNPNNDDRPMVLLFDKTKLTKSAQPF